jgi:ubiquinone/menaquinone biosynthesis C-methylase UbiE
VRFRWAQEIYQERVIQAITPATRWLDAGCGWHVLPAWPGQPDWQLSAEQAIIARAALVVGVDVDPEISKHRTIKRLVLADLNALPFRPGSFTLVTLNMVAEHLRQPQAIFRELSRILAMEGSLLVHTPNAHSYFALSHWLPRGVKLWLLRLLGDDRPASDVFPTAYLANSTRRLRCLGRAGGLAVRRCEMITGIPNFPPRWRFLYMLETLLLRLLETDVGRPFRATMIVLFRKEADPAGLAQSSGSAA